MNFIATQLASSALVTAGLFAASNLLRIFVGDWREHRRAARGRGTRSNATGAAARRTRSGRTTVRRALAACFAVPALSSTAAFSQDAASAPTIPDASSAQPGVSAESTSPPQAETAGSALSLQLNLDYTSAYFYHGIIQEDSGLILQPAAKLTINLFEKDDLKIDALLGVWNSFHGQKTGAQTHGDFSEYWYEADLIGGFAFSKDKLSLTATYTFLTSPSDAYETVQEVDFTLAYDDSELLGKFALHPYVLLGVEVGADASDGANSDTGTYLEFGIAPGFSFDMGQTPVAISFPASVGLSLNNYYQDAAGDDETFGFAQIGVKASIPLPFGDRYGAWTLNAGVSGMYLGDNTADYNGGEHEQLIGTIGLQVNF